MISTSSWSLNYLENFFDGPINDPPTVAAPFEKPFLLGEVPKSFDGQPLKELTAKIGRFDGPTSEALICFGGMWIDRRPRFDPNYILVAGLEFRLNWPRYGLVRFYEANPSRIVYDDSAIIIYDKEAERPSQGVPHDAFNNVLAAMERLTKLTLRLPHRLDAGTSGLLILAKNKEAAGRLGRAFQEGRIKKRYLATSVGSQPDWTEHTVTAAIAKAPPHYVTRPNGPGLSASTKFKVLGSNGDTTLFLAEPLTGRTHQIRLHLAFLGYPVLGDRFYGNVMAPRLMLRAVGLTLEHPLTSRPLELVAPGCTSEMVWQSLK